MDAKKIVRRLRGIRVQVDDITLKYARDKLPYVYGVMESLAAIDRLIADLQKEDGK